MTITAAYESYRSVAIPAARHCSDAEAYRCRKRTPKTKVAAERATPSVIVEFARLFTTLKRSTMSAHQPKRGERTRYAAVTSR